MITAGKHTLKEAETCRNHTYPTMKRSATDDSDTLAGNTCKKTRIFEEFHNSTTTVLGDRDDCSTQDGSRHNYGANSSEVNPSRKSADDSLVKLALLRILQQFQTNAAHACSRGVPTSMLEHLSQSVTTEVGQNSSINSEDARCRYSLKLLIVGHPGGDSACITVACTTVASTTASTRASEGIKEGQPIASVDSQNTVVEVTHVASLDEAFNFIQIKQEEQREINCINKTSEELKYMPPDSSTITTSSSPAAVVTAGKDEPRGVKLNRKMRRFLSGKTLKGASGCPKQEATGTAMKTAAVETNENYKVCDHFMILLPTMSSPNEGSDENSSSSSSSSSSKGSSTMLSLKEQHDISFVAPTLQAVSTTAHISYMSYVHIISNNLEDSTVISVGEDGECSHATGNKSHILVHPNAGIILSSLQIGKSCKKPNRRKQQFVYLTASNVHFRHCVQQPKCTRSPGGSRRKDLPIFNNSFLCGKGLGIFITLLSCQFEDESRPTIATSSLSSANNKNKKWDKKLLFVSPKASKNLFSVLRGAHLKLTNVLIAVPSLSCGVYASGKSHMSLEDCHISDVRHGCGVKCEAGSSIDMLQCSVKNCGKSGVFANNALRVHVRECDIERNGRCGVEIFSCQGDQQRAAQDDDGVTDVTLHRALSPDVLACCSQVAGVCITQSNICENSSSGILLLNSLACIVANSSISRNQLANISALTGTTCDVYNCVVSGSGRSGIFARDEHTAIRMTGGEMKNNNATHDIETEMNAKVTTTSLQIL
jgi:hypothetical protein